MVKRFIAAVISTVIMALSFSFVANAATIELKDIVLRDPCVLEHEGKYYLYGTGAAKGRGYGCYVSTDLKNWEGPKNVFSAPDGFDGTECFWAPECVSYNGSFYLFATYKSQSTGHRGVSVFRSDKPDGEFTEISDGHATPSDRDSIDGTLYVDPDGQPWMVYVDEWTGTEDGVGRIDAAKMSDDLTHFISEPIELFRADSAFWAKDKVTDGPFLYTANDGSLLMIWSNFNKHGYCVGTAHSIDGKIDEKWQQSLFPLYQSGGDYNYDGGHGMIFTGPDGKEYLSIHSPNGSTEEKKTGVVFIEITENNGELSIADSAMQNPLYRLKCFFEYLFVRIGKLFSGN